MFHLKRLPTPIAITWSAQQASLEGEEQLRASWRPLSTTAKPQGDDASQVAEITPRGTAFRTREPPSWLQIPVPWNREKYSLIGSTRSGAIPGQVTEDSQEGVEGTPLWAPSGPGPIDPSHFPWRIPLSLSENLLNSLPALQNQDQLSHRRIFVS